MDTLDVVFHYDGTKFEVNDAKSVLSGNSEEVVEVDDVRVKGSIDGDEHWVGDDSDEVNEGGTLTLTVVDEKDINVNLELLERVQAFHFIDIDGCHLKRPHKVVLFSAVALDANNGLYHVAFCICEGKGK
ncbi:hypothetical protein Q3G72_016907 [Acer saccharum]|nr:hypothetical protein Q3G72_016907 [Acer saccharum]